MISRFVLAPAAVLALACSLAGPAAAGPMADVINFSGQFGTIDMRAGTFIAVGPGVPNTPTGLGGAPGGPYYTIDGITGHLIRFTASGAVTDVGDTGTGPNVGPDGISLIGQPFERLGHQSGNRRWFAAAGVRIHRQQTTSFSGTDTLIYFTLEIFSGANATGPTLFTIDPVAITSTALPLIPGGNGPLIGSGYLKGVLYGFTATNEIVTIDRTTGVETIVASYDAGFDPLNPGPPFTGIFGAVATPEPGPIVLTVSGFALVFLKRLRASAAGRPRFDRGDEKP